MDKTTLLERVRRARTNMRTGNTTPQILEQLLADVEPVLAALEAAGDPVVRVKNTLSFAEAQAVGAMLSQMNGDEDTIIATNVAAATGFARSIIVTALTKMEAGGLLKSWSLGMKGTRVKILVPNLRERLQAAG